jgi:hypothetical protein
LEICGLYTITIRAIFPQLVGKLPAVKDCYSSTCHGALLADTGLTAVKKERDKEKEKASGEATTAAKPEPVEEATRKMEEVSLGSTSNVKNETTDAPAESKRRK